MDNNNLKNKEVYWSRFAEDFEERNNYVVGVNNIKQLKEILSKERNLGKTLELACGNGTYTKVIAPNATEIVATDYSDEMLEVAKQCLKDIDNIMVQKENCFELSFENNSFDTVFMANLLHVIPQPEKAISECYRVLKENGKLIIVSYTSENMSVIDRIKMIYRYCKTYGKPSSTAYNITRAKAEEMMQNQRLNVVKSNIIGETMKAIFVVAQK